MNDSFSEIKRASLGRLKRSLEELKEAPNFIVLDGTATKDIILNAEKVGCRFLVAKNFETTDTKINLLSL